MIDLKKMSILIVDDMDNMCRSIRSMLKILDYGSNFRLAGNGKEALQILRQFSVDLAIIDWNMPVMTGIELLDNIRENKELRDMPVIMITAEANSEIVAEAAESDIDAYLLKPITVQSLGTKIEKVIEKANHPPESIRLLKEVRNLIEAKKFDEAIPLCKQAIEADPRSSRPIRTMGEIFFKKEDIDLAERWFVKAAQMNHLDVFSFHHLGDIYLKRNDLDKAFRFYEKAMKISPRHVDRAINFGKVLLQKGKIDKAGTVFENAIRLSGNPMELREDIGTCCLNTGAFNAAIAQFDIIHRQFPKRLDIMKKLAIAHESTSNPREALAYLVKISEKDPDDFDVHLRLARIYVAMKQTFRAEEILQKLQRKDPEHKEVQRLIAKNL
ncbi:tetratricopeptide repeat protein [Desulfobotulus alkaliphilus]|uniref:Tetratricopeptide repeat protein n=1 Tax=Desulfobotulus alkaliphilus TaxID=622671 RepID=A0A562R6Z4_9BACT|nr:tetratricopeptide repeat protein [Desulfobotulus alkaliphilus]TWI64827.1 tetratricopeptide repeat protein [Desulfobotulus alkaliphilus]